MTTSTLLRTLAVAAVLGFATNGCSSTAGADGGGDSSADTGADTQDIVTDSIDSTSDVTTDPDVAVDTGGDVTSVDVASDTPADGPSACANASDCHPFYCGCGTCNPSNIVCVSDARECPLGCALSCPELATTECGCVGGACAVQHTNDGGGVRGDGGLGSSCSSDTECGGGLLCCYPCGIPGCSNQCLAPMNGHCPLFP